MKKLIILLAATTLLGCELVLDLDVPFEGERLVINSFFHPDSNFSVMVSKNRYVLDNRDLSRVANAQVVVYDESNPIDTLIYDTDGFYDSDMKPLPGHRYSVSVTTLTEGTATGWSGTPFGTTLRSAGVQKSVSNDYESEIKVEFDDDPSVVNYYELTASFEIESLPSSYDAAPLVYLSELPINSDDIFISNGQQQDINGKVLIKDLYGSDGKITAKVKVIGFNIEYAKKLTLYVREVSGDYFRYQSTNELQQETSENPFAQPVNVYSNIENGFGIFAGIGRAATYEISTPEPIITSITPSIARVGDIIDIYGANFGTPNGFFSVYFRRGEQWITGNVIEQTYDHIRVVVPPTAVTGKIMVYANSSYTVSETSITIVP